MARSSASEKICLQRSRCFLACSDHEMCSFLFNISAPDPLMQHFLESNASASLASFAAATDAVDEKSITRCFARVRSLSRIEPVGALTGCCCGSGSSCFQAISPILLCCAFCFQYHSQLRLSIHSIISNNFACNKCMLLK